MPGGRFNKQAPWKGALFLNANNANDTIIGGNLSGAPAGFNASQGFQDLPGDRIIFTPSDALAYCNNNIANMFTGVYRYVQFRNNSTASPTRTKAVWWDAGNFGAGANNDGLYQVTADGNQANGQDRIIAGVCINNITLTANTQAFWWIQECGKAICQLRATPTGNNANTIGQAVFTPLPVIGTIANNNVDNGCFDIIEGANSAAVFTANSTSAYTTIAQAIAQYVGVQESTNSTNNINVDIPLWRTGYRW